MATRDIHRTSVDEETTGNVPTKDCPECDGRVVTEAGETRCGQCGLIIEAARVDRRGPRSFSEDDRERERTGAPLTNARHDRGLSTEIGGDQDTNGNSLSDRKRRQLSRLRREHSRAKWGSKAERNLGHGCTEIARMVSALGLERSLREQASTLFRTAQQVSLLPGRSIEAMATACVYAACRCNGHTRTLDEIVAVGRVERSRVRNAYRVLQRELELAVPPRQPAEFVPKLASAVEVAAATRRLARDLAKRAQTAGLTSGSNPAGFAAGCLAVAAAEEGESVLQRTLANAADVCPATVRSNRALVRDRLGVSA